MTSLWRSQTGIAIPLFALALFATLSLIFTDSRPVSADDPQLEAASGVHTAVEKPRIASAAAPLGGANINASSNNSPQNETTIAINPTDLDNLIGGSNDYAGTAPNGDCGRYRSTDRGATWTRTLMPRADAGFASAGDPGVAFEANGNAYYLCMNFNAGANDATQYVHKSLDGGSTWGPAILAAGNVRANFDDKGHIAVDNISATVHTGNVYISFSRLNTGQIRFNRSTDGGATFTGCPAACGDIVINDANPGVIQGSNIAVGADGAVYVAWADNNGGATSRVMLDKSTDGGVIFNALGGDRTVRTFAAIGNPDLAVGGIRPLPRVNSFPVIKAHPTNASIIYAVWAENPAGNDDSDIMFARSTDGGMNWGAPTRINDDVNPIGDFNSQFFPWMAVDPTDNEIDIVWYDDRFDANKGDATPLVDLMFASSTNNGLSFSANKRISTASSDPTVQFTPAFFGDYNGIDARDGVAFPLWTQTTGGDEEAFTTQVGGANLAITKTDSPDPVTSGGDLVYTINVTNDGPATAFNTTVVDTLSAAVTYVSDTDACAEAPVGTLTCDLGTLEDGDSASFTINVKVDADAVANGATSISNTAVVSSDQEDPDTGNNTATATTLVNERADLRVLKECKPDQPNKQPAGVATFCDIYVDNLGPSDARNVSLVDQIISNTPVIIQSYTLSSTHPPGFTCLPATPTAPATSITVTCTDSLLPVGARNTVRVNFVANATGDVNDTATVSSATPDPDLANNNAVGRVSFASSADLELEKTDSPDPVLAGTNITYVLTATNNGPSPANDVVVKDVLPVQVTDVSVSSPGNTCVAGVPGDPQQPVLCNMGTLADGASEVVTIVAKVKPGTPDGTILFNQGMVSASTADPDNSNNNQSASTNVDAEADLAIVKTADAAQYKPNTTITYRVRVTNNGPSDALNVVVVDTLPEPKQAIYLSDTGGCIFQAPKSLTCNLGTILTGASKEFFIMMKVHGAQGDIVNSATVDSTVVDPNAANDTSSVTVAVKGGKP